MEFWRGNKWIPVILIMVFLFLISVIFFSHEDRLEVHQSETAHEITAPVTEQETLEESLRFYSESGFSISVPESWVRVVENEQTTDYIHRESGTAAVVEQKPYDRSMNSISAERVSEILASQGYKMTAWTPLSNASGLAEYENNDLKYAQLITWDRESLYTLTISVKQMYYDRMQNTIQAVLTSFSWSKSSPIPDDCYVYYSSFGDCEIGLPINWNTTIENGVIVSNSASGAVMTVEAYETTEDISSFSETSYASFASSGRNQFMLESYSNHNGVLYAESTYFADGQEYRLFHLIETNGRYEYILTAQCPNAALDSEHTTISNALALFRYFESNQ